MEYSKTHQKFSNYLQKPEALTNPQDFLGLNYQAVINFWWYLDSLTADQWKEVATRYRALVSTARYSAGSAAWDAARYAAGYATGNAAGNAAWDAAGDAAGYATGYATYELIGCIENPVVVPLFEGFGVSSKTGTVANPAQAAPATLIQ